MPRLDQCARNAARAPYAGRSRRVFRLPLVVASAMGIVAAAAMFARSDAKAPSPAKETAQWIWSPKYAPGDAPDGPVYFRKVVDLPEAARAKIFITCDNTYELFINGSRVGAGDEWEHLDSYNALTYLNKGANTIAVKGTNVGAGWAGLVVRLDVVAKDKKKLAIVTDASWKTSVEQVAGWQKPGFDDANWSPARSFGKLGSTEPWGDVARGHAGGSNAAPSGFKLPDGFKVEQVMAGDAGSIVAMTFMENGDLLVSAEGGSLYVLRNYLGDPSKVQTSVYCDKVRNCQGILDYQGHVYAVGDGAHGTGLYRLTDSHGSGAADQAELLFNSEGGMGDHGPHQPIVGPDGLIYLLMGNHAHYHGPLAATSPHHNFYEGDLVQPKYEDANGHARGIKAPGGTVTRFSPSDLKNVELFCGGFRNAYHMAFNRQGELFTFDADMEWDENLPWYRPIRVNHAIPGAEFGWRSGWSKWPDYYLDSLGSVYDVGRGSPTGLVFYNHTAFPAEYRDAFFMCDWSRGRMLVSHLQPDGATFKGSYEVFLEGNPMNCTDCDVGPDGALYFTTGGRGTRGAVYRIVWEGTPVAAAVATQPQSNPEPLILQAIHQPQLDAGWSRGQIKKLRNEVGDKWEPQLIAVATSRRDPQERRQALELLQLFGPAPKADLLLNLAQDSDPTVRAKATYLLGLHRDDKENGAAIAARLTALLDDPEPLIQRLACESLVRSGHPAPVAKLIELMGTDNRGRLDPDSTIPVRSGLPSDRYLSWAAMRAVEELPMDSWRSAVLKAESPRAFLMGSVALLAMDCDRPTVDVILARCEKILAAPEHGDDHLDALRLVQLCLIHGSLEGDQVPQLREQLSKLYPISDWRANRELVRLLVYLQDPTFAARLVPDLKGKLPTAEKLHLAMYASRLQVGWTPELRDGLLKFYESTRTLSGGNSFHGYIANATREFLGTISQSEKVERLAAGAKTPETTIELLQQLPEPLPPEYAAALRQLDRQLIGDKRPAARDLATAVLKELGKHADPQTLAYLHATFESAPERREDVAAAVAQYVLSHERRPEERDLLVRSLTVVEDSNARDVLLALSKFEPPPKVDPELVRQIIMAGLKLGDQGGRDAVNLLERWLPVRESQPRDTTAESLVRYQKWFVRTYPNQLEPKLPVESTQDKYSMKQLTAFLDSDRGKAGDPVRGAAVFEKALCVKCHKFGNRGEGVGPDLTNVTRRFQHKEILESVLYPSLVISDQFASKTIITKDGRSYTGIVGPTPDGVTVMQSSLKRVEIKKVDIDEIVPSKISAMPERLFNALSLDEIADLFAYLHKIPE